ncbi:DUF1569 domain-containing protein [Paraflavitalea sp. CAU 1676]|uniref:DUF1569 domain-containing protein n=1 Tax=Paraflavitalea sp. CAU 1676 TaxID=3032598 RepID=UPI0023DB5EA0|nr:DUF1569 domain-containing protein [Paraflavitalea sp. CAU 1676]MDF2188284.1 DUF1569 domain-containing protein [Paraflavitalea sp. CAU 1676]
MQTIFDEATRQALIHRISQLKAHNTRQWGKMNVYQMLKHCTLWEEMVQSNRPYKQVLLGRLFGRVALRSMLKDESPLRHNTPTIAELKITGNGDVETQKAAWIERLRVYAHWDINGFAHPFFGKMTREQVGYLAYKHCDHHLRQFNA